MDIVIVGVNAAGIGAARRLTGSGLRVLLLEASQRIGGRAWTIMLWANAIDMDCGCRSHLTLLAGSRWAAMVGSADHTATLYPARRKLREPIDPRIHFAGEACSATDFSTHGALSTGIAAAEAVIASLG